jgi:hypothetical protein
MNNVDARMFLDGEDTTDTASISSGSTMTVTLRRFATGVENHMYYM